MLTETLGSTILTASVTCAGLLIAIYALITPLSSEMSKTRVEVLRKKKEEFDKIKEKITAESPDKDFKRLKELAKEIKIMGTFPRYLSVGVLLVFMSCIMTSLYALAWLQNPTQDFIEETAIIFLFITSLFGFFWVGIYTINDVYQLMKAKFESFKKDMEEIEKSKKEIEREKKKGK